MGSSCRGPGREGARWTYTHLSPVDIVQHKVELLRRLEGVAQAHEEGVAHVLQEHATLRHDVALLQSHTDGLCHRLHGHLTQDLLVPLLRHPP